jgi:hypothetical protein
MINFDEFYINPLNVSYIIQLYRKEMRYCIRMVQYTTDTKVNIHNKVLGLLLLISPV